MILVIVLSSVSLLFIILYFFQERLIFHPEVLPKNYKYDFTGDFEEKFFEVSAEIKVNALHFKVPDSKGVILYAHGNAGSLRGWGELGALFTDLGYDVLIYDFPGYGKSEGNISEKKLNDVAEFIYNWLLEGYPEEKIILYGRSLGTGITAYLATSHHPQQVILESPYYNMPDLSKKFLPFVPSFLLRYKFLTNEYFPAIKSPVTIFHGTDDEVVYFGSCMKLKKLFKSTDQLVIIEGGHHNDLSLFSKYHKELKTLLD